MKNKHIKEYTTKQGEKLYKFQIYLGKNATTGTSLYIRKRGFKTYKEASKSYKQVQEQIKKGVYSAKKEKHYKVNDLVKLWLKGYKNTVRESTYASTQRILDNHILPDLGNTYLDKLTVIQCMDVVNKWAKIAPVSVKKFMNYTNIIFNKGVEWHMMPFNPMSTVDCPKFERSEKDFIDFYTKEELDKFLQGAKKTASLKVFMFFRLLAYSGMRRGEALALTWGDINFKDNYIKVNKTVAQGENNRLMIDYPKTKSGIRIIDIDLVTMNYLKQWKLKQLKELFKLGINAQDDNQLVFSNTYNKLIQPSRVAHWNNVICKANDLRHIKVHGFRHTHATLLHDAGVAMKDIQERLGHANITTTMDIYTHLTNKRNKETLNQFEKYMNE